MGVMAKQDKKLGDKVRKYRIVFHNFDVTDETIRDIVRKELGDDVEVDTWEEERVIHYRAKVDAHSINELPQREIIVRLGYREYLSID